MVATPTSRATTLSRAIPSGSVAARRDTSSAVPSCTTRASSATPTIPRDSSSADTSSPTVSPTNTCCSAATSGSIHWSVTFPGSAGWATTWITVVFPSAPSRSSRPRSSR